MVNVINSKVRKRARGILVQPKYPKTLFDIFFGVVKNVQKQKKKENVKLIVK